MQKDPAKACRFVQTNSPAVRWPRKIGPVRFIETDPVDGKNVSSKGRLSQSGIKVPLCLAKPEKRAKMTRKIVEKLTKLPKGSHRRLVIWRPTTAHPGIEMHVARYLGILPVKDSSSTPTVLRFAVEMVPGRGLEWHMDFVVQKHSESLKVRPGSDVLSFFDPNATYYLANLATTPSAKNARRQQPVFLARKRGLRQNYVRFLEEALRLDYHHYPTTAEQKAMPAAWTVQTRRPRTHMLGLVHPQAPRPPPDGWYLPVFRYPALYYDSNEPPRTGDRETFCGTFYYVEPESRTLLHLGNTMVAATKFHALVLLSRELERNGYLEPYYYHAHNSNLSKYLSSYAFPDGDTTLRIRAFWKGRGVRDRNDIDALLQAYYGVLPLDASEILQHKVALLPCSPSSSSIDPKEDSGSDDDDDDDEEDDEDDDGDGDEDEEDLETAADLVGRMEEYASGRRLPWRVGWHDRIDQTICSYARKLKIDTIVLQHEVGEHRAVTEILDTRENSLDHLYRPRAPAAFSLVRETKDSFSSVIAFEQKDAAHGIVEAWWKAQLPSCATLWFPKDGLLRPAPDGKTIRWRLHPIGDGWGIDMKNLNLITDLPSSAKPQRFSTAPFVRAPRAPRRKLIHVTSHPTPRVKPISKHRRIICSDKGNG